MRIYSCLLYTSNSDGFSGVDLPILLNSTPQETLEHRRSRNRDGGVDHPLSLIHIYLSEALDPFLAHTNPFCLYMKSEPERFHVCLSMIRKMHDKLLRTKKPFFGVCHAGLGEYVVPVYSGDLLLLSLIHI